MNLRRIYGICLPLLIIAKHTHVSDEHGESKFTAHIWSFIGRNILVVLLSIITLGIATPWALCSYQRWVAKHTIIDGREIRFEGRGGALFLKTLLWGFLTIITLGIFVYSFIVRLQRWIVRNTSFVVVERKMTDIDEVKEKAAETCY